MAVLLDNIANEFCLPSRSCSGSVSVTTAQKRRDDCCIQILGVTYDFVHAMAGRHVCKTTRFRSHCQRQCGMRATPLCWTQPLEAGRLPLPQFRFQSRIAPLSKPRNRHKREPQVVIEETVVPLFLYLSCHSEAPICMTNLHFALSERPCCFSQGVHPVETCAT